MKLRSGSQLESDGTPSVKYRPNTGAGVKKTKPPKRPKKSKKAAKRNDKPKSHYERLTDEEKYVRSQHVVFEVY